MKILFKAIKTHSKSFYGTRIKVLSKKLKKMKTFAVYHVYYCNTFIKNIEYTPTSLNIKERFFIAFLEFPYSSTGKTIKNSGFKYIRNLLSEHILYGTVFRYRPTPTVAIALCLACLVTLSPHPLVFHRLSTLFLL